MNAGTFIRVKPDHENTARAGKDGMVMQSFLQDGLFAMVFWYDRHNRDQGCACVGPELWDKSELDMSSVEH